LFHWPGEQVPERDFPAGTFFWYYGEFSMLLGLSLAVRAQSAVSPINLHWVDSTIAPGDNFYRFANGHWLSTTAIPANQSM